jgi:hypothetical protein
MELDPPLFGNTMPLRNKNEDDADLLKGHGWIVFTGRYIASRNDLMHRILGNVPSTGRALEFLLLCQASGTVKVRDRCREADARKLQHLRRTDDQR